MFQYVRSILSGMPPVAPPADNVPYVAAVPIAEGTLVTVPSHTVAGKISLATDVTDVFGVALNTAAPDGQVRVAYVVPGMIFKTLADSQLVPGTEAGINPTADGVMGVGTGLRVLRCVKDTFDDSKYWAWVVFTESALSTDRSKGAMITAFKFDATANTLPGDLVGVIDHAAQTISVDAPTGTLVTTLKADFTVTESATVKVDAVDQTSGTTANDFTAPVKYDVTSADGKKVVSYTVIVTVATE